VYVTDWPESVGDGVGESWWYLFFADFCLLLSFSSPAFYALRSFLSFDFLVLVRRRLPSPSFLKRISAFVLPVAVKRPGAYFPFENPSFFSWPS
jgi:hypothetical protein